MSAIWPVSEIHLVHSTTNQHTYNLYNQQTNLAATQAGRLLFPGSSGWLHEHLEILKWKVIDDTEPTKHPASMPQHKETETSSLKIWRR